MTLSDVIRPGNSQGLDFVLLDELRKRTGISTSEVYKWTIKEMLSNSLDTDATDITVKVRTVGDFNEITVLDDGSKKITLQDVKMLLDFSNKASSKRGLHRVTRGTHGNALKCVFGYSYALAREMDLTPPEAYISSHGETFRILIAPNRVSQKIEYEITVVESPSTDGNSFTFRFPVDITWSGPIAENDENALGRQARVLLDLIQATCTVNPMRRITYDLWGIHRGSIGATGEARSLRKITSVLWYEPGEFIELLYDFARARPEIQLREFIYLFRGFTAKKVHREILHVLNDSANHDSSTAEKIHFFPTTKIKDLSPTDVELLYYTMHLRAKTVKKRSITNVLGCVGQEQFEAVKEREGWADLKYMMIKDRVEPMKDSFGDPLSFASYPYLIELAVFERATDDIEGPKIYQCVNFMASDETLFNRVFNVNQRLGQVGITPETPATILIHLVCPVLKWLNYAKTTVGGDHIGRLMKKAFNKLLPVPKQPRKYRLRKPKVPVSWFPRGNIKTESYRWRLRDFAKTMKALDSERGTTLSRISARGWGYILEGLRKIHKGEFNALAKSINDCIKLGYLPIDFTAADQDPTRRFKGIHVASNPSALLRDFEKTMNEVLDALPHHTTEYWAGEEYYLMMLVEKIDIYNLFEPICKEYNIPIANLKGWYTLKPRFQVAELSRRAEERGQKPVLLLFCDHDIAGLKISQSFRDGLRTMMGATGWDPSGLIIDRFGLNFDDIEKYGVMWIPNLKSGSGNDPDLRRRDVQEYISTYGVRKCEANALLKNEETLKIGQQMCRNAIEAYYGVEALARFRRKREESKKRLKEIYENPVWNNFHEELNRLFDDYDEKKGGEFSPPEAETEYAVKIYERIDEKRYRWGKCPVCKTLFNYNKGLIGKMVRCRTCNTPMRLIKAIEGDSKV